MLGGLAVNIQLRLLLALASLISSLHAVPSLLGARWGADTTQIADALRLEGVGTKVDSEGDLELFGTVLGFPARGSALFAFGGLVKLSVTLICPDDSAFEAYAKARDFIVSRVGRETSSYEIVTEPYIRQASALSAIAAGHGHFATFYSGADISVSITQALNVDITVSGPLWPLENSRRIARHSGSRDANDRTRNAQRATGVASRRSH
jgi:hypothetical protein